MSSEKVCFVWFWGLLFLLFGLGGYGLFVCLFGDLGANVRNRRIQLLGLLVPDAQVHAIRGVDVGEAIVLDALIVLKALANVGLPGNRGQLLGVVRGGGGGGSLLLLGLVGGAGGGGLLCNLGAAGLLLLLAQLSQLGLGGLGGLGGGGASLREVLAEGRKGGHHGLLSDIPALRADGALVLEELGHGHGGRPRDLLLALGQGGVHLRDAGLEDAPHVLRGLQPPVGLLLGGVRVLGLLGALGGLGGRGRKGLHLGLQGRQLGLHGSHLALQGSNLCGLRGHFGL